MATTGLKVNVSTEDALTYYQSALLPLVTSEETPLGSLNPKTHKFTNRPNPQVSSPLLGKLPVEVLRKILKLVMLPTKEIPNQMLGKYPQRPQLSAQLLRCCQRLYVVGKDVLYNENTLYVALGEDYLQVDALCFHIMEDDHDCFDFGESRRQKIFKFDRPNVSLVNMMARTLLENFDISQHDIRSATQGGTFFSATFHGLSKIRRVEVDMCLLSRQQTWDCLRLLQKIVSNKDVVVNWNAPRMTQYRMNDLLRSFQQWRCRSIKFKGLPKAVETRAAQVVDRVVGATPVEDLFYRTHCLHTMVSSHPDLRVSQRVLEAMYESSSEDDENPCKTPEESDEDRDEGGDGDNTDDHNNQDESDDTDSDYDTDVHAIKSAKRERMGDILQYRAARHSDTQLSQRQPFDPYELWTIIRRCDSAKYRLWYRQFIDGMYQYDAGQCIMLDQ